MRVFQKRFVFQNTIDACHLTIKWGSGRLRDYDYPISYTLEDCLEDWCAGRGHNFISFHESTRSRGDQVVGDFKYYGKNRHFRKVSSV